MKNLKYIVIIFLLLITNEGYSQLGNKILIKTGEVSFFSNLDMAFSFQRRVSGATLCLRIRRDNDDAETDLLLESFGECDINSMVSAGGTLAAWIGANNGFMVTDYDQTGNGYDFTQSDKTKQAKLVDATTGWLGYKGYATGNIYYTSGSYSSAEGSVYIKMRRLDVTTRYFLSQALPSGTDDDKIISLATSFGTGSKLRILDFTPAVKTYEGDDVMGLDNVFTYRCSAANKHSIRLNSDNQILTIGGAPETDNWFDDYALTNFTLQKGQLHWDGGAPIGSTYREFEMLVFSVEHDDTESQAVEDTMTF